MHLNHSSELLKNLSWKLGQKKINFQFNHSDRQGKVLNTSLCHHEFFRECLWKWVCLYNELLHYE